MLSSCSERLQFTSHVVEIFSLTKRGMLYCRAATRIHEPMQWGFIRIIKDGAAVMTVNAIEKPRGSNI